MSKNHLTVKPHIFTFYHIFSKAFFLLIFPFLQQIFLYPESIWQKVIYTIFNLLFIVMLITVICLEYKQIRYIQHRQIINFERGLFHHNKIILPSKAITVVSVTRSIILWFVHCCRVYIGSNTCAKTKKLELFTTNKASKSIIDFTTNKSAQHIIFKSRFFTPALMALTQSNALAGILAVAVIFKRLGTLLGEELADSVIDSINLLPKLLVTGLPPTLEYSAAIVFAGFIFGLVNQLIINLNFTSFYNNHFLFVCKGFIKKSILCVNKPHINGVLIKQSLLMCIAKMYTLSFLYTGFKDDKNSGVYIPLTFEDKLNKYVSAAIPVEKCLSTLKPPKSSTKSYLYTPIIFLTITLLFCLRMYDNFKISFILRFAALVLIPFGVLWLWFRLLASKHCRVTFCKSTVKIGYFNKLNLMLAVVYKSSITKVVITRNPWQQLFNKCHLILYVCDKKKMSIKVKHLNFNDAEQFVEKLNLY